VTIIFVRAKSCLLLVGRRKIKNSDIVLDECYLHCVYVYLHIYPHIYSPACAYPKSIMKTCDVCAFKSLLIVIEKNQKNMKINIIVKQALNRFQHCLGGFLKGFLLKK